MPHPLRYLLRIYLTGLAVFFLFRLLLMLLSLHLAEDISSHLYQMFQSYLMGARFDTVVSGYLLALPLLLFLAVQILRVNSVNFLKFIHLTVVAFYSFAFLVCSVDIPFFMYFSERLNGLVFQLQGGAPKMLRVVLGDWRYYFYLIFFALGAWSFTKLINRFFAELLNDLQDAVVKFRWKTGIWYLFAAALLFVAMRGRLQFASPIKTGTAYFSDYAFANKLALNPVFSFTEGSLNYFMLRHHQFNLMDAEAAITNTRQMFGIDDSLLFQSPVCRAVSYDSSFRKMNVVLVLMESMAAGNMKRHGNTNNLTPFFDSLCKQGIVFDNFYSNGTHTQHGIYSTLTGFPCLPHQHSLIRPTVEQYECLPRILADSGYTTAFFTSHDAQLDNIEGFCKANGFKHVFSNANYPEEQTINSWGVPDHYLFDFALERMNDFAASGQPFFSTVLTISNHPPYQIPSTIPFTPTAKHDEDRSVQYADWSMQQFMRKASRQKWFDNTLFVFVADHGRWVGKNPYAFALSFTHVPLLLYAPRVLNSESNTAFGTQADVQETVLGLLRLPHYNNTFGVDLLRENRAFAYFCSDDKLGYIDRNWFFFNSISSDPFLYKYHTDDLTNYAVSHKPLADSITLKLLSIYQTAQWMVQNRATMLEN